MSEYFITITQRFLLDPENNDSNTDEKVKKELGKEAKQDLRKKKNE